MDAYKSDCLGILIVYSLKMRFFTSFYTSILKNATGILSNVLYYIENEENDNKLRTGRSMLVMS